MNRDEVIPRIEAHLRDNLMDTEYDILDIDPKTLITYDRFDLAIKIYYLQSKKIGFALGKKIYEEHIFFFSQGTFEEPGCLDKDSIEKYYQVFSKLYRDIEENGFNSNISLIPISKEKKLLNGAHRVSVSYFLNKKIKTIILPVPTPCYDFRYFLDRGMSKKSIEVVVREFILMTENSYVALVWPSASGKNNELRNNINNLIYEKEVFVNHKGAHNLLSQVYTGAKWLGDRKNNYEGIKVKLEECFNKKGPIRVFSFQAKSLNEVIKIKSNIRDLFGIGNNSIHITDTKEEAIKLAEILFNDNSIHFLNNANPNRFLSTFENISEVKKIIKSNNVPIESVLLDTGMVLSAYGLREANDIDVLSLNEVVIGVDGVDTHDSELIYHGENKESLIYNPEYYFYFEGLKFTSFKQLQRMKNNRSGKKDIEDIVIMESIKEGRWLIKMFKDIHASYYYHKSRLRIKIKSLVKRLLIYFDLYEHVKTVYRSYIKSKS